MSDHKAEAERLLPTEISGPVSLAAPVMVATAHVHATLYLAEQQRIANLIAFMDAESGPYKEINNIEGGIAAALAQIREGLGLS